jgi:hypothetical protein
MWVTFFNCRPCLEEKTDRLMSTQLLWVVHNWGVITGTSSSSSGRFTLFWHHNSAPELLVVVWLSCMSWLPGASS